MAGITLLLALGMFLAVLLALIFRFNQGKQGEEHGQDHVFLQFLFVGLIMASLMLLGKAALDNNDYCDFVAVNATVNGSLTQYDFAYECVENDNSTAQTFFDITLWLFRIYIAYVMVYIFYYFFSRIRENMFGRVE